MDIRSLEEVQAGSKSIFDLPLKVAYYARVSTDKDEQLNSLENQKAYYAEYIRTNPNWTFAGGYVDEGITGTSTAKREQFLQMIADAQQGRFDLIVTKEISRFARNTLDSIRYTRELLRCGVGVFFQNDNINTFDRDAELRLTIMSSIAQDEVRKISERTRFGFKRAQENSVLLGQNNLYGYNKSGQRLEVVEPEAAVVREVFERYVQGELGLRAIANDLDRRGVRGRQGKPLSYATLQGMLRNPKYKGCYAGRRYGTRDYRDGRTYRLHADKWLVHEDERIPAIVPPDLWEDANRLLDERGERMRSHAQASQNRYAYSGKLICAKHGTSFHRHVYKSKRRGDAEAWNCRMYRLKGKKEGCDSPTLYSDELDCILERVFSELLDDKAAVISEYLADLKSCGAQADFLSELRQLDAEADALRAKQEKLLELTLEGLVSKEEFKRRNDGYSSDLDALAERRDGLSRAKASLSRRAREMEALAKEIDAQWQENHGFSREMAKAMVDRVVVGSDGAGSNITLDIFLKLAPRFHVDYERPRRRNHVLSLDEIHISQAQVSRLEKGALERIRKKL